MGCDVSVASLCPCLRHGIIEGDPGEGRDAGIEHRRQVAANYAADLGIKC